jgi:hypothetical protein
MVMVGQQRRLEQPLSWGRRERWAVIAIAASLVLAAVAVGIYALTATGSSTAGCVELTTPSTTGSAVVRSCGQDGRDLCRAGVRAGLPVTALRGECRRLRYPFGPVSARP